MKKLADAKVAKVAKEEQAQSSHNALFNPGKAAPPPARKDSQPSKKARLGRPSGSRDSEQRTRRTDDGATVAEGQRLAEDGKRVRVARTFYVSGRLARLGRPVVLPEQTCDAPKRQGQAAGCLGRQEERDRGGEAREAREAPGVTAVRSLLSIFCSAISFTCT